MIMFELVNRCSWRDYVFMFMFVEISSNSSKEFNFTELVACYQRFCNTAITRFGLVNQLFVSYY